MKTELQIRRAAEGDLARLTEIYNESILDGGHTCDTTIFTPEQRRKWFSEHQSDEYPLFVAVIGEQVIGYAYLSPYRGGRAAVRTTAEISYYFDLGFTHRGYGTALCAYVIAYAKSRGIENLFAILLECNAASLGLLEKLGFEKWGELKKVAHFGDQRYSHLIYGKKI